MSQLSEHIDNFGKDTWWFTSEIKAITYAKCYLLLRGYHYAVSVEVKRGRDLVQVDEKIHRDYDITYDKAKAKRRRDKGLANVRMIRYDRSILVLATHGEQPNFFASPKVVNLKKQWLSFGKHKIRIVDGGKERVRIRVREGTFDSTLQNIKREARGNREELEAKIRNLNWYWSKDTLNQRCLILKRVNQVRKSHSQSLLQYEAIKKHKKTRTDPRKNTSKNAAK